MGRSSCKKALVIRYGAHGDAVMISPLIKQLDEDGYEVHANLSEMSYEVLRHNPRIKKFIHHKTDSVSMDKLKEHWEKLSTGYDKVVNLTGSIEGDLLIPEWDKKCELPKEVISKMCNKNYTDHTMSKGGYEIKGAKGELHFTPMETQIAKRFRKKYAGKFLILWPLSGSSFHKAYPHWEYVAKGILAKYPFVEIILVGDSFCQMLTFEHERVHNYIGKWGMRHSMIMTKYVDLVVGNETGVMNAAACYDVPKVIMLSHSSEENLTKYWTNTSVVQAITECGPCHKLLYNLSKCPTDPFLLSPVCMANIKPATLYREIEKWILNKKAVAA